MTDFDEKYFLRCQAQIAQVSRFQIIYKPQIKSILMLENISFLIE